MRNLPLLLAIFISIACDGNGQLDAKSNAPGEADADTDADADADADTDTDVDCLVGIAMVTPEDGATNIALDITPTLYFTDAVTDTSWSLALTDSSGTAVAGSTTLASDGLSVSFSPSLVLSTETTYTLDATTCGESASSTFSTVGPPVTDTTLVGNTYAVAYADIVFTTPVVAGLLDDLGMIDFTHMIFEVSDVNPAAESLDFTAATGVLSGNTITPTCATASPLAGVDFSNNPQFTAGPLDLPVPVAPGVNATFEDFTIAATFNGDASELQDILITGALDTREIDPYVPIVGDACAFAAASGDACVPCADGAVECLTVLAWAAVAPASLPSIADTCVL